MLHPSDNVGELSTGVSQDNFEAGVLLQHTAENQVGCGNGGIQRVSDKIAQIKIL